MSILELILIVVALLGGVRLGVWLTNNQRDNVQQIENVYRHIDELTRETKERIDTVERDLHSRIDLTFDEIERKKGNG